MAVNKIDKVAGIEAARIHSRRRVAHQVSRLRADPQTGQAAA